MNHAESLVRSAAASTIGSMFAAQVRLHPARIAIQDGDRRLTYALFGDRVNRAASALAKLGIVRGDRVAILSENRVEYIELQFACAKLGAIAACQNWRLSSVEIRYCLELVGPKVVFVSPRHSGKLNDILLSRTILIEFGSEWERRIAAADPAEPMSPTEPEDPLLILYTSGTTGMPKGAVLSHRCELYRSFIVPFDLGQRPGDTNLCWPPLYHMGGTEPAMQALITGGRVIVMDGFDAPRIADTLLRERFGWLSVMPGTLARLIEELEKRDRPPVGVTACGVMPDLIPPHEIQRLTSLLGADFCNCFGATETGTPPMSGAWLKGGELPVDLAKTPSIGTEIRLVDEEDADVPDGIAGELAMRGPSLFSGYWRNEEATASDFRNGWFHMGDLFRRRPDGRYDFVDRAKYLIKSGGENIYPAEIERVLVSHPKVADAVVVRRKDAQWGEVPIALVVARDPTLETAELAARCRDSLARYKQPREIRLVPYERITRSTTGKVQRKALEAWVAEEAALAARS